MIPGDDQLKRMAQDRHGLETPAHIRKCFMGRFQSGDIIETLTNSETLTDPEVKVCARGHTASQHFIGNCDLCTCLFYEPSNPAVVKCFMCRHPVDSVSHYQMCQAPQNPAATPQQTPKGEGREILPLVIEDLKARIEYGTKKYGEPLKAFNRRDALMDAYQEALDLAVYLKQAMEERSNPQVPKHD